MRIFFQCVMMSLILLQASVSYSQMPNVFESELTEFNLSEDYRYKKNEPFEYGMVKIDWSKNNGKGQVILILRTQKIEPCPAESACDSVDLNSIESKIVFNVVRFKVDSACGGHLYAEKTDLKGSDQNVEKLMINTYEQCAGEKHKEIRVEHSYLVEGKMVQSVFKGSAFEREKRE